MKVTKTALIVCILLIISSCSTNLLLEEFINNRSPLALTIRKAGNGEGFSEHDKLYIQSDSEKFNQFLGWLKKNNKNWKRTYATYLLNYSLSQEKLRISWNQNLVVIEFRDNTENSKQFCKVIEAEELNFLLDTSWTSSTDTVTDKLILSFKHPRHLVKEWVENCICIGENVYDSGSISNTTKNWCIWMQDTSVYSIESLISKEKSSNQEQLIDFRDSVAIGDTKALCVTFVSETKNDFHSQIIYLKKFNGLFEIVDSYGDKIGFETFYKSILIENIKRTK